MRSRNVQPENNEFISIVSRLISRFTRDNLISAVPREACVDRCNIPFAADLYDYSSWIGTDRDSLVVR
jgi:hypothetical protein